MLPKIERLENRQLMSAGPALTLASSDALPFTNRLIFNRIQNQNPLLGDLMHDSAIVRLINTGDQPLTIQQLSLSSSDWQFAGDGGAPMTIGAGQEVHVQLNFVATTLPAVPYNETAGKVTSGGGTYTGTLTINSNDAAHPTQSLQLAGYWQKDSEHGEEPSLQTIVNLIGGYKTNIASGVRQTLSQGSTTPTYYGEEIAAPYWMAANPNQPVNIQQIASWHVQGRSTTLSFYDKGDSADPTTLLTTLNDAGQELFPEATPDYRTSFTPAGAFGLTVDGEFSDDTLNTSGGGGGHHFRFYPLRDANNNLIPNSFLVAQDYGGEIANFDFQDGVFILTNARPEAKLAVPANLTATVQPSLGISLQWSANVEPNLAGYNVYRATSAFGSYGKLNTGLITTTSFIDATASAGVTYFYHVTAVSNAIVESYSASTSAVGPTSTAIKPLSPTGVAAFAVSGKQINISWNDVAGEAGYKIERSPDGINSWKQIGTTTANDTTFNDVPVAGTTKSFYRVRAYNHAGSSGTIGTASATTSLGLPSGWNNAGISTSGNATATGGVFSLSSAAGDIDGSIDGFQYAFLNWTGNGQIIAHVTGITADDDAARVGVMVRESLDPSARNVMMDISAGGASSFDNRAYYADGTTRALHSPSGVTTPYWIRMIRAGNTFTGFTAADGIHWTIAGSATVTMNSGVLIGLAATAGASTNSINATIDHVTVSPVPAPAAPGNLLATHTAAGQISLSWLNQSAEETGFKVERSIDGIHFSQIAVVTGTSYINNGLAAGMTYTYRVRATLAGIDGGYSALASATA